MGSLARKLKRNQLKKELGNNNISELFHASNDPLWKKLSTGLKNAQKEKLTNKK